MVARRRGIGAVMGHHDRVMARRVRLGLAAAALPALLLGLLPPAGFAATTRDVSLGDARPEASPTSLTIHRGDSVRWTNKGLQPHSATADSGLFDSGPLGPGGTFTLRFDAVGTFPYHCSIPGHHGSGTIVVAASSSPTTTTAAAPPTTGPGSGGSGRPGTGQPPAGGATGTTLVAAPTTVLTVGPGVTAPAPSSVPTYLNLPAGALDPPPRFAAPASLGRRHRGLPPLLRLLLTLVGLLGLGALGWEGLRGRVAVPSLPSGDAAIRPPWRAAAFDVDVPPWDDSQRS
jgi:plastocyanin